uniref:Uncharacterized protein n=1 Tax=Trichobilharzia regenti TaxID=157069 RepID=A0AA85JAB3_TRIRE|nr:unnamed protein product [Trichobilharzia regenti]
MASFNNNNNYHNAAGNKNTHIWSVGIGDAEDESYWDDSDLLAQYTQIESVVKISSTKDDEQNEVADFVESETPNEQFTCNLNWIPPCVNPPEHLFSQLPYSSEYSSFNAQPAYASSQPVFTTEGANFPKIDPIARAWYDAGYRLGRLHALKMKATSSVKVSNS